MDKTIKSLLAIALSIVCSTLAVAQNYTAEQHVDLRVTGMLLAPETPKRDDIVVVEISVQGAPMLLRVGKVEEASARERSQVAKHDVLFKQVRFTGPEELMQRLLKPETMGKVITIEGWLNTRDRLFQVTTVTEGADATSVAPQ